LTALGRATYAAASLNGIAVDVLRTHCGLDYWTLLPDTLGRLRTKLRESTAPIPGLTGWVEDLAAALVVRNDLLHATPVAHGLHRRTHTDRSRVVNFFDVADLERATAQLTATARTGNALLYYDGGAGVERLTAPRPPVDDPS